MSDIRLDLNNVFKFACDLDLRVEADRNQFRTRLGDQYVTASTADLRELAGRGNGTLRGDALRIVADDWIITLLSRSL